MIIQDTYGNYVVQFFYEYLGSKFCWNITNVILERFKKYSVQKFSGNVLVKCVDSYWNLKDVSERLRTVFGGNSVLELYRCK